MNQSINSENDTHFFNRNLMINVGLALLIFLFEELGRLVGLTGLNLKISPFWPASGVALAAVLLWGWRVCPGIFAGLLIYNAIHLTESHLNVLQGVMIAIGVSAASLIQAILGAYLINRFSSKTFYHSLHATTLFLLIVIFTCLIASTFNMTILYAFGYIPHQSIVTTWVTFWAGDTIGAFLLTPLILSFVLNPPSEIRSKDIVEVFFLFTIITLVSVVIFFGRHPISVWFIPFLLWTIFRFNIRGLSAALVLISFIAILATAMGYGPYETNNPNQSLFYLVIFFGIITATMLILTSVYNENREASRLLKEYNLDLEGAVNTRTHELQEAKDEILVREKLTSLAVLASGISHEIKNPLLHIHDLTVSAQEHVKNIQEAFEEHTLLIPSDISDYVNTNYNSLKDCLIKIEDCDKQAQEIVNIILQRSKRESEHQIGFKLVNIHNILNGCCSKATREFELKTPYALHIKKDYDLSIGSIEVITMDLSRAFSNIINNSVYSLKEKAEQHLEYFEPTLSLKTTNREHDVEICIEDNGMGMSEAVLKRLFQPFFSTKPLGESTGLGLALVHDIIVQDHSGTINVISEKDKFTKTTIVLPKIRVKNTMGLE